MAIVVRFCMPRKGVKKSPNSKASSSGRPPKNRSVGKQPPPEKQRTADSRAKIEFQRTAKRWITSLSSTPGVILDFMARKILLVVMLNTILLLSSTLKFGVENVQLGVKGMTNIYEHVSKSTGVSTFALKDLWNSTTEDSKGTVHVEVPEKSVRGRGSLSVDREKLRKLTPFHLLAISKFVEWCNATTGQVRVGGVGGREREKEEEEEEEEEEGSGIRGFRFTPPPPPPFLLTYNLRTWRSCFRLPGHRQTSNELHGARTAAASAWRI